MINCVCIDGNTATIDLITRFCADIQFLDLQKTFKTIIDGSRYVRRHPVDVIFLNTEVDGLSGLEFYKEINQNIIVVFISDSKEFAVEAYNLNAIDYLLQPFDLKRFIQSVNKVHEFYNFRRQNTNSEEKYLQVRSEYSLIKIAFTEILYIETLDDYIKIHLLGKKPILTLMSMKTVMEKLPDHDFIRVHRSYIVPINRIESVRGKTINLGITEIPIGKSHEEAFFKAYIHQGF